MRAVDTNVLVRLATGDDPQQTAAAERFVAHGAWVPQIALVEMAWVLESVYGLTSREIAKAIAILLEHETLSIQEPEVVAAALAHFQAKAGVGFSDCLVLEVARKAGHVPLGTFDRALGKLPGAQRL